jgi:hypothetical protein
VGAGIVWFVFVPILILFLAALSGAVVAYGTHPAWAQYAHGLDLILLARHLQWPLAAASLAMCLTLAALVVAGRRRAWWLIGLGPILALFVHRFATDPLQGFAIVDNPAFVWASEADFLDEKDYVVGLVFDGSAYAYPYSALYYAPVVVQAEHDQRMVLMWSAFANRAVAYRIAHDLRARDLEIVSMPANALLLYNNRLGQFINGLTGQTTKAEKPSGFSSPLRVWKTTWATWLAEHPQTRVMVRPQPPGKPAVPNAPLQPWFPLPRLDGNLPRETIIELIDIPRPVVILPGEIGTEPISLTLGDIPAIAFRDPSTGQLRVFDRHVEDLVPKFKLNRDPRRKQVFLVDSDTNSGWSVDGRAVDGPLAKEGKRLAGVPVDHSLNWGVIRTWMPDLKMLDRGATK